MDNDRKDLNDVERRVKDIVGLFGDLVKSVIKDIFNEMTGKMN
jgi:t-SNARE complex subunit (syntaxin)